MKRRQMPRRGIGSALAVSAALALGACNGPENALPEGKYYKEPAPTAAAYATAAPSSPSVSRTPNTYQQERALATSTNQVILALAACILERDGGTVVGQYNRFTSQHLAAGPDGKTGTADDLPVWASAERNPGDGTITVKVTGSARKGDSRRRMSVEAVVRGDQDGPLFKDRIVQPGNLIAAAAGEPVSNYVSNEARGYYGLDVRNDGNGRWIYTDHAGPSSRPADLSDMKWIQSAVTDTSLSLAEATNLRGC